MTPFADRLGPEFRKLWLQAVHRTLEKAGPAFIKWGQWAATRPDLFPRDLCAELAKLHTKAPEHSFAYTKRTIERAFGRKLSEIFESFDEMPVASGSIAQVHRASLGIVYPGQKVKPIEVAVKVRHPGVGESIRRDFDIINAVVKISNCIPTLRWLRLDESVQQFAVFMMSQVDLSREAAYLNRFIYNFRRSKDVSFPKPLYPLVHPAVLVETYEQGESVTHFIDDLEGHDSVKAAVAHIGTHALLKMLLVDNFIHADMHPGNILVRVVQKKSTQKQAAKKSKPHLVLIDVGMTAELSKTDRVNLLEFFKAVARRDGVNCCKVHATVIQATELSKSRGLHQDDDMQLLGQMLRLFVGLSPDLPSPIGPIFWITDKGIVRYFAGFAGSQLYWNPVAVGSFPILDSSKICLVSFRYANVREGHCSVALNLVIFVEQQNEVKESFAFWGTPAGALVHPADAMQQLLDHVRRHKVNIDGNVTTVLVTTLVLEGWQRKLDPDYNIMRTLQSMLFKVDWAQSLTYTIEGLMAP
ncbi:hypothetical protein Ancab_005096 [Ancistrocladus abbreviatus]